MTHNLYDTLRTKNSPAYVIDLARIKSNMAIAHDLKTRAGCKIVLATKAFAMPACFPFMQDTLDGTTASGLHEARLGAEHFGKDVHTYSPAFTEDTLTSCLTYSTDISFNSIPQLKRFAPLVRRIKPSTKIGLRINPSLPQVTNSALYNPSAPGSRYGAPAASLTPDILALIDTLHVHNLCENMAEASCALIHHLTTTMPDALRAISHVNLGGGHYITHPDYNIPMLAHALHRLRKDFTLDVTLEPGGALVYDAGYLLSRVLDVFTGADGSQHAIMDASASTHMPDILEVPYRPHIINSAPPADKAHTYHLGGNSCMTGDHIGIYSFDQPLTAGDPLIFTDMAQYSFVKNTSFNGIPLPDLALLHPNGHYETVKTFTYDDFLWRLGS